MGLLLLIVVLVVLVVGGALIWIFVRRAPRPSPSVAKAPPPEDPAAREARHRMVDEHGTELLERRVDLDARRGTLAGDSQVYDAFDQLEGRFHAGEISEDEFEAGKIRILGG